MESRSLITKKQEPQVQKEQTTLDRILELKEKRK